MRRTTLILNVITYLGLGLTGCSIIDAPPPPPPPPTGLIYVTAVDTLGNALIGGSIAVDGLVQIGKLTPDTIETTVGLHWISVEYAGFIVDSQAVNVIEGSLIQSNVILAPVGKGTLYITAHDSLTNQVLSGAMVFLEGALTNHVTPDSIVDLPVGTYSVCVAANSHDPRYLTANIASGQLTTLDFRLPAVSWNGTIRILSDPASALTCVDEILYPFTPWVVNSIGGGSHNFSAYKEGYANLSPILQTANLNTPGYQELTFTLQLWAGGVGYNVGQLAPGFSLQSDYLDTVSLGAYRGRVVLLTFWFRNCQGCIAEMPEIEEVYETLSPQGFRVLGIDYLDNIQVIQQTRQLFNPPLSFELLRDPGYVVTGMYGVWTSFPTNVLIDQRGVVSWYTTNVTYQTLYDHVMALLSP